jgi:hypothetical protein
MSAACAYVGAADCVRPARLPASDWPSGRDVEPTTLGCIAGRAMRPRRGEPPYCSRCSYQLCQLMRRETDFDRSSRCVGANADR